ncbi:metal-binding protein [Mucilaginibacter sp. BJC16-A38]|uniref:Ada metal-binding domain-containing protein n=1 Tax=Mucilaginibacter phenanthrenivorans TaxID=1234842 RepID=UPI0021586E9D|nr:Ada metal-binding domain-containing protein [Mucilaginibacter phenanthrenivorans]MCR8558908.1 metal-binding protein [Mucilaginibacter phenanthrenivorans]
MIKHSHITDAELRKLIRHKQILLGGNRKLKIYGTLNCKSGRRMKRENRVFFTSGNEAIDEGYRPCGHCMIAAYKEWKNGFV